MFPIRKKTKRFSAFSGSLLKPSSPRETVLGRKLSITSQGKWAIIFLKKVETFTWKTYFRKSHFLGI